MTPQMQMLTENITDRKRKNGKLQNRKIISRQLQKESILVREESMKVLDEFENSWMRLKLYEIWISD